MKKRQLNIVHLYPREMNIYGDTGNVLCLEKRCEWRGIEAVISHVHPGEQIPSSADIVVSGGGQDRVQSDIKDDLADKAEDIKAMVDDGVVFLVVCGTYQLFGHRFITAEGVSISGISIFDAETVAGEERLIGNIFAKSKYGELIGYENHSGLTSLAPGQLPLANVKSGSGNNGRDGLEGAVYRNAFGTYLHGPLLPKNPRLADELIGRALKRRHGTDNLKELDDRLELKAATFAKSRPR